jgi:hypothetical protein
MSDRIVKPSSKLSFVYTGCFSALASAGILRGARLARAEWVQIDWRNGRKAARISPLNSSGCSQAAK